MISTKTDRQPYVGTFGQPIVLHNPKDYYELLRLLRKEYCGSAPHRSSNLRSLTTVLLDKLSDEISVQCGYHNVEHFNRQFKSIMGCTPGKYRKQDHMSI